MPCAMLRPWFRGGCHACFCRPDGWIPSVLVLCKHEVSPWRPKRTARSAPPSFSPPSRKLPPVAAQKFQMAYHLMFDCEQLQTPLLVSPVALIKLHRRARSRVAWTEFGSVGVGRTADRATRAGDPVQGARADAASWRRERSESGPMGARGASQVLQVLQVFLRFYCFDIFGNRLLCGDEHT